MECDGGSSPVLVAVPNHSLIASSNSEAPNVLITSQPEICGIIGLIAIAQLEPVSGYTRCPAGAVASNCTSSSSASESLSLSPSSSPSSSSPAISASSSSCRPSSPSCSCISTASSSSP